MARGIKVVTPSAPIGTTNPTEITIDTRQPGAFKVHRAFNIFKRTADMTSTYLNGAGITVGKYEYFHNLGYAPAFIVVDVSPPLTSIVPQLELLGGPALHGESDSTEIVVDGIDISVPTDRLAIYIFEENLDADV